MKIELDIDVQKIAEEILEGERSNEYYSLKEQIKNKIKNKIEDKITWEIFKSLNLNEFREERYGKKYLTETAKKILDKELKERTQEHCNEWIKRNLKKIMENHLYEFFNEKVYPLLSKIIANSIVVNDEKLKEEWDAFAQELKSITNAAYESGCVNAYNEIRKNI